MIQRQCRSAARGDQAVAITNAGRAAEQRRQCRVVNLLLVFIGFPRNGSFEPLPPPCCPPNDMWNGAERQGTVGKEKREEQALRGSRVTECHYS
jgi:hypothetical protein